ncbi:MAG: site-specific DNA-methyltransferase, partial [Chloroflexi bacterium]|nr:site-specific DNA-methyltransferase [Chloroflexota bacterium]
ENLEFVEWTRSVWRAPQVEIEDAQNSIWKFDTQRRSNGAGRNHNSAHSPTHPSPFPLDLPLRLILLYTNIGDVVLDPFMGSGTTALAAKMTQRQYIGYEISSEYCALTEERLAALGQPPVIEARLARKKSKQVKK